MSMSALCRAVKARLQTALELADTKCDIGFDGQPNPSCGELFIRIWPGEWSGIDCEGLGESFSVNVTITMKLGSTPKDRWGPQLWARATDGLEAMARRVLVLMHLDVGGTSSVLNQANTLITGTNNEFVEPLRFRSASPPELKSADWFESIDDNICGVAQTLTFGGATRYQTIESMI